MNYVLKAMKRLLITLILSLLSLNTLYAEISKKSLKEVKREVKALQADGWQSAIAGTTIEEQAVKVVEYKEAVSSDGTPIYIVVTAEGKSVRDNIAQAMALNYCKSKAAQSVHSGDVQVARSQLGRTIVLMKLKREEGYNVEIRLTCAFKCSEISAINEQK